MSVICYHGTKVNKCVSILRDGFRPGSYFALHLEDALEFGGSVVFRVIFDDAAHRNDWQFFIYETVPPDRIIAITEYVVHKVYGNPKLQEQVFQSNTA